MVVKCFNELLIFSGSSIGDSVLAQYSRSQSDVSKGEEELEQEVDFSNFLFVKTLNTFSNFT